MSNPNPKNQFTKGKSGNPDGRPKKEWTFAQIYKDALEEVIEDEKGNKHQIKDIVAKKLSQLAAKGDVQAIRILEQRIEGMPKQSIDQSNSGKLEISFTEEKKQSDE